MLINLAVYKENTYSTQGILKTEFWQNPTGQGEGQSCLAPPFLDVPVTWLLPTQENPPDHEVTWGVEEEECRGVWKVSVSSERNPHHYHLALHFKSEERFLKPEGTQDLIKTQGQLLAGVALVWQQMIGEDCLKTGLRFRSSDRQHWPVPISCGPAVDPMERVVFSRDSPNWAKGEPGTERRGQHLPTRGGTAWVKSSTQESLSVGGASPPQ